MRMQQMDGVVCCQVVRRRMMAGAVHTSVLAAMRTIAAEEGWMALYRGLGVSCIKQAPQTGENSQDPANSTEAGTTASQGYRTRQQPAHALSIADTLVVMSLQASRFGHMTVQRIC
jgi:Mitochondrial carrier protein